MTLRSDFTRRGKPSRAPVQGVSVQRFDGAVGQSRADEVVVEEPLAIQISGERVLTTLRTPGDDRELVLGYLLTEGAIGGLDDVSAIAHCGSPDDPDFGNVIEVTPSPGMTLEKDPLLRLRPNTTAVSACGVCGREQILALLERCRPLASDASPLSSARVIECCEGLARAQTHFIGTGGLHAAAVFDANATLLAAAEDVGRHNAVDKVLGRLLLTRQLPASGRVLVVTSRAGFEIVQKACVAEIPIVICLSAPTTLAIETAEAFGMTLIGFVRGAGFNVYAGAWRVS